MGRERQNKEYLLHLLMQSSSLHDLLAILQSICERLTLTRLNPKKQHFRDFQFTFFGLMVKAKGLLEMMVFRTEFIAQTVPEFKQIHSNLSRLMKKMQRAYSLIHSDKMIEGKEKIIECSKEYQAIFDSICNIGSEMILQ